jgi:hypothetical protein
MLRCDVPGPVHDEAGGLQCRRPARKPFEEYGALRRRSEKETSIGNSRAHGAGILGSRRPPAPTV